VAGLVDVVIVGLTAGIVDWLFLVPGESTAAAVLALTLYGFYHAGFFWLWDGQTPGLAALDIRMVSDAGEPLSIPQALLRGVFRSAMAAVLSLPAWHGAGQAAMAVALVLGLLLLELGMMVTLPGHQTLSDMAARTLAVDELPPAAGRQEEAQPAGVVAAKLEVR
jgi:uncharacterized RDD family membrane protein YckC